MNRFFNPVVAFYVILILKYTVTSWMRMTLIGRPVHFTFCGQAAASCYIELIVKESDNNVKLIVLDRLIALRDVPAHEKVLQVILRRFWLMIYSS
jgi:hypothetical protein